MKSNKSGRGKSALMFISGILIGVMIMLLGITALAGTSPTSVDTKVAYRNLHLYIDGVLKQPMDTNGKVIEPFIWTPPGQQNGYTFVPLAYISNELGYHVTPDLDNDAIRITSPTTVATGTITGTAIVSGSNAALQNATVRLLSNTGTQVKTTTTNASGAYTFTDVTAGTYTVEISAQGYTTQTQGGVIVTAKITTTVGNIALVSQSNATISGRVTDSATNAVVTSATVRLINASTRAIISTATTNASGYYTFSNVAASSYIIEVSFGGYTTSTIPQFSITGNTSVQKDVVLARSNITQITGRVTDGQSGYTLQGATVQLYNAARQPVATVATDANGYYAFSNVSAGTYTIDISLSGYASASVSSFTVSIGATPVKNMTLARIGTATVSGRISDEYGSGLSGATVTLVNSQGTTMAVVQTNNQGNYSFSNVYAGTYFIEAALSGYGTNYSNNFSVNSGNVVQNLSIESFNGGSQSSALLPSTSRTYKYNGNYEEVTISFTYVQGNSYQVQGHYYDKDWQEDWWYYGVVTFNNGYASGTIDWDDGETDNISINVFKDGTISVTMGYYLNAYFS